jgi:hypothetical protein
MNSISSPAPHSVKDGQMTLSLPSVVSGLHCDVLLKLKSNNVTKYLHSMDLECESESNYTNWEPEQKPMAIFMAA